MTDEIYFYTCDDERGCECMGWLRRCSECDEHVSPTHEDYVDVGAGGDLDLAWDTAEARHITEEHTDAS